MTTLVQKAARLSVWELEGEGNALAVTSGSTPNSAYVVRHNSYKCLSCPCGAGKHMMPCSHKIAGDRFLEAKRRAAFVDLFDPHGLSL
jgi:hypothetical protein